MDASVLNFNSTHFINTNVSTVSVDDIMGCAERAVFIST